MSTKIYRGFSVEPGTSIFQITRKFRELLDPVRDRLDAQRLASKVEALIDQADLDGVARPQLPIFEAARAWDDQQNAMGRNLRSFDPDSISISFGEDPETGLLYAIVHTDTRGYDEAITQIDGLIPYPYWNNTDRPDDVTKKQWAQRADVWKRVLPGIGRPLDTMVTFELRPAGEGLVAAMIHVKDAVPSLIRTPAERAATYAINRITSALVSSVEPSQARFEQILPAQQKVRSMDRNEIESILCERLAALGYEDLVSEGSVPDPEEYERWNARLTAAIDRVTATVKGTSWQYHC